MRTRLPTLLLVVCLALAGCTVGYSGPTATPVSETTPSSEAATPTPGTDTPSETPASYDSGGIEVTGGRLDFNAGQVYDRMAGLLETSAQGPERIRIRAIAHSDAGQRLRVVLRPVRAVEQ